MYGWYTEEIYSVRGMAVGEDAGLQMHQKVLEPSLVNVVVVTAICGYALGVAVGCWRHGRGI